MMSDYELTVHGLSTFLRDVIDPAVYPMSSPLAARILQVTDPHATLPAPIDVAQRKSEFDSVSLGDCWGPKWSTAWFDVSGEIPQEFRDTQHDLVVRFSSGTEALLWIKDDTGSYFPERGLDVNRDEIPVTASERTLGNISLLIEAACNHPFGVLGFEWDPPETLARWNSPTPGRLERCEISVKDQIAYDVKLMFTFLLGVLRECPTDSARNSNILRALCTAHELMVSIPIAHIHDAIKRPSLILSASQLTKARKVLAHCIGIHPGGSASRCTAVGHAHIDTAWLWPIRETKRKCLRSFSNQLRLMERFPRYKFMCSQAQQYAWVQESSPHLFAQIADHIKNGQWEPQGAMWVEPDCNCPSGESLVRQILHGVGYWNKHFPGAPAQRILYLPDTFGFPATLPQIMSQCGLDTFITNKLHWNKSNTFPHTTFMWRGLDGSTVLAHNTPGKDYNAVNTPKELTRGEKTHKNKDVHSSALWLQPFGYGDGGGGATEMSIRFAQFAGAGPIISNEPDLPHDGCDGLPIVNFGTSGEFAADLWDSLDAPYAPTPPVWDGELYLELHRGTLTSQAWIKQANRRAEDNLRFAEMLACAGSTADSLTFDPSGVVPKLHKAWETVLLNQFHDILPGSSIGWVYDDARNDYARIDRISQKLIDKGTTAWLKDLSTIGITRPVAVFNPTSWDASGVVELESGELMFARDIPAFGVSIVDAATRALVVPVTIQEDPEEGTVTLCNGLVTAVIDSEGEIVSLYTGTPASPGRELVAPGESLNKLVAYEDVPHMWDAWDIDVTYERKQQNGRITCEAIEVVSEEPLRCALRITKRLGESRIEQIYTLDANAVKLDIHTRVDWKERRTLLRALMHTDIHTSTASYDIQFGVTERPTHRTTSWDAAKFEVCAHQWMDLSDRGGGLAILNDCKYGHSCHGTTMGITLLRGPTHPDPQADIGEHEFTYSLLPHHGDWRSAAVAQQAALLNSPFVTFDLNPGEAGTMGSSYAPVKVTSSGNAHAEVTALKFAEDGDGVIIRLFESHGGRGTTRITWNRECTMTPVNLLEQPIELTQEEYRIQDKRSVEVTLRPWQIVTLRVRAR